MPQKVTITKGAIHETSRLGLKFEQEVVGFVHGTGVGCEIMQCTVGHGKILDDGVRSMAATLRVRP